MDWKRGSILALCSLLLAAGLAAAAPIAVEETPLKPSGEAYELHGDGAGTLWASDYSGEIRKIQPASGAYVAYPVPYPLDAQPDAAGRVWFSDGAERFGYLNPAAGTVTSWSAGAAGEVSLWGLAFDDTGHVWLTEWFGAASRLRRFDLAARELCAYALPGGVTSYYVLYHKDTLWLVNWGNDRIYRFMPATGQATWWQLPAGESSAQGLALDGAGRLWFADTGANALRRFEPSSNQLTTYVLPTGSAPQMVTVSGGLVWYTGKTPATVGALDPAAAAGSALTLAPESAVVTPTCTTLGGGTVAPAVGVPGALAWTSGAWAESVAGDGWTAYTLPAGSLPWGIAAHNEQPWVVDQGRHVLDWVKAPIPPTPTASATATATATSTRTAGPSYKCYLPVVMK